MKLKSTLLTLGAMSALATSAFAQTHVTANITTNTTWTTSGSPYILEGVIYVTDGAILDIAPGVVIRGQPRGSGPLENAGSLIIARGSKIQARGTAAAPIIMTTAGKLVPDTDPLTPATLRVARWSAAEPTTFLDANPATAPLSPKLDLDGVGGLDKVQQLWGGLVLCGYAQTNNYQDVTGDGVPEDGVGLIEGLTGLNATYGGTQDDDNSGIVQYVSIRHGGDGVVANKEINALTCYSVGSETTIRYVDVYCTSDDGVEMFGGNVNLEYLNINYADDDGFDTDEGYRGTVQHMFILQGSDYGDSGMELDGDDWDESQALAPLFPISDVQIRNATVISRQGELGVHMRNGFNGALINSILWKEGAAADTGILVEALGSNDVAPSPADYFNNGSLQIRSVTAWNFSTFYSVAAIAGGVDMSAAGAVTGTFAGASIPSVYYPATNNRGSTSASFNPGFTINHGTLINPVPTGGSGAISFTQTPDYVRNPGESTSYRGAFNPTASQQWTFGWTALNIAGVLAN